MINELNELAVGVDLGKEFFRRPPFTAAKTASP